MEALGGITASFSAAFEKMAASVAQSESMAKTMNAMMEGVLVNSLKVSSNISYSRKSGKPELLLTVENASRFPIPKVTVQLECSEKGVKDACLLDCESLGTPLHIKINEAAPEGVGCKRKHGNSTQICLDTVDIAPSSRLQRRFVLHPHKLAQYNLQIAVKFPSPGTGRELEQTHSCGLYYLHQGEAISQKRKNAPDSTSDSSSATAAADAAHIVPDVPASLLRSLLLIGPSRGLDFGPDFSYLLQFSPQTDQQDSRDVCLVLEPALDAKSDEIDDPLIRVVCSGAGPQADASASGDLTVTRFVAEEISRLQRHHATSTSTSA
jgi:hypothetical protein